MKTFEANQELQNILLKNGFIETTSERDKLKGKKSFKLSKTSQKEIYFDYINIRVFRGIHEQDNILRLSEHELKLLLMFFKMPSNDIKEILSFNRFTFSEAIRNFENIKKELHNLIEFNFRLSRQIKLKRIISFYENLALF